MTKQEWHMFLCSPLKYDRNNRHRENRDKTAITATNSPVTGLVNIDPSRTTAHYSWDT